MFRDLPDAFFIQDGVSAAAIRAGEPRVAPTAPAADLRTRAQAPVRHAFHPALLRFSTQH
jgi:hypothetical protein